MAEEYIPPLPLGLYSGYAVKFKESTENYATIYIISIFLQIIIIRDTLTNQNNIILRHNRGTREFRIDYVYLL